MNKSIYGRMLDSAKKHSRSIGISKIHWNQAKENGLNPGYGDVNGHKFAGKGSDGEYYTHFDKYDCEHSEDGDYRDNENEILVKLIKGYIKFFNSNGNAKRDILAFLDNCGCLTGEECKGRALCAKYGITSGHASQLRQQVIDNIRKSPKLLDYLDALDVDI